MSDNTKEINSSNPDNSENKDSTAQVHSANAWEKADLGDDGRKQKFLRLMGAAKKDHHGTFVIGDADPVHMRNKGEISKMSEQLEEQYEQSMEHRQVGGRKGHIGLGFHKDEENKEEAKDGEKEGKDDQDGEKTEKEREKDEETGEEQTDADGCGKRKHSDDSKEDKQEKIDPSPNKKIKPDS